MKCYRCNRQIDGGIYCDDCLINDKLYKKIYKTSRQLYNSALQRAGERKLTLAKTMLIKSLEYDKKFIDARNLLGLLYFKIGEIGEAIKHWNISVNINNEDNIAIEYLEKLQQSNRIVQRMNSTIKMYNEALTLVKQNSEDLAIIRLKKAIKINHHFVKAYNLLALCYMKEDNHDKAFAMIKKALEIDKRDMNAMLYSEILKEKGYDDVEEEIKEKNKVKVPQVGQKINHLKKEQNFFTPFSQLVLFAVGVICGIAVIYTLVLPDRIRAYGEKNEQLKQQYEQQIVSLNKENEANKDKLLGLEDVKKDLEKQIEKYKENEMDALEAEILIKSVNYYLNDDIIQCAALLIDIEQNKLDVQGRSILNILRKEILPEVANNQFYQGYSFYDKKQFNEAIPFFQSSLAYSDNMNISDNAQYYLARSFQQIDNKEKAKDEFEKFFDQYPNSELISYARTHYELVR